MSLANEMPKIANFGTPWVPSAPPAKSDSTASTMKMSCIASDAMASTNPRSFMIGQPIT